LRHEAPAAGEHVNHAPSQTVFSIGYEFHAGNGTACTGTDNGNVWNLYSFRDRTRDQSFNYGKRGQPGCPLLFVVPEVHLGKIKPYGFSQVAISWSREWNFELCVAGVRCSISIRTPLEAAGHIFGLASLLGTVLGTWAVYRRRCPLLEKVVHRVCCACRFSPLASMIGGAKTLDRNM
jgi:hypothetical protein